LSASSSEGIIKLSDGTTLKLMVNILDARESGFSPLGGVNIFVKPVGGTAVVNLPKEIAEQVKDKPVFPSSEMPQDGWELVEITEFKPAIAQTTIDTSKGKFMVKTIAEPSMASRNLNYKSELGEPIYYVVWATKISWKSVEKSE
jgi:hypothetical protein